METLAIQIDETILRNLEALASRFGTSLESLVGNYLHHLSASGLVGEGELNGNLEILFEYSIGQLTRKEAARNLGVDDARLTQMMRLAGFPPPRSSRAEEDAQVESALKILEDDHE
jgi:hypothetical protein